MADLAGPDPGTRGHLDVRLAALTRIVEQVLVSTDGVEGRTSALGTTLGRVAQRNLPRVDVRVVGRTARVRAEVGCVWPAPVAAIGERVRGALVTETERLTGLRVRSADVVVHVLRADEVDGAADGGRVA